MGEHGALVSNDFAALFAIRLNFDVCAFQTRRKLSNLEFII